MVAKLKFKKGDKVIVLVGKDKGKRSEILRMIPTAQKAIVQGVNVAKKHVSPSRSEAGGIVDKELPINISNLSHIDPKSDGPTRVGYKFLEDGRKVRYAKRSGEIIDS